MNDQDRDAPLSERELDADRPDEALSQLLGDTKASASGEPDWEKIDEKLFARIE